MNAMVKKVIILAQRYVNAVSFAGAVAFAVLCAPGTILAEDKKPSDDPDFLSVAVGAFDFNRKKDEGVEGRIEYRSDKKLLFFKPFGAIGHATSGHTFVGAGVLIDLKEPVKLTLLFIASASPCPKVSVLAFVVVKDDLTPFITIV